MALTTQQQLDLLSVAKEVWINVESDIYAYKRTLREVTTRSDVLKIATIAGALLTAATGFFNLSWLTIVTGLAATALATFDRVYALPDNLQKVWSCLNDFDLVKSGLSSFAVQIDSMQTVQEGVQVLNQIESHQKDAKKLFAVVTLDSEKEKAVRAFAGSTIDRIIHRIEGDTEISAGLPAEDILNLAEDAPGVVPAYRPNANPNS
jgi:hypothetical protein